jgi:amino acid adenylation domain-containing protein
LKVLLQEYVSGQAERRPDATALVMGERRLTYAQLEEESNRLARVLLEQGCAAGDRICLFAPKSPEAIVGMLASLKTGGIYVPLDLASPAPRVGKIVQAAEPRLILTTNEAVGLLDDLATSEALPRDVGFGSLVDAPVQGERFGTSFSRADSAPLSGEPLPRVARPDDVAHLLFTSGSTGTPKGVMVTHSSVAHFVEWATTYFGTRETDRISGHPPLHFDLSTFDIYGTFRSGAELHLFSAAASLLPQKLAALIRLSELTQWFAVPSTFTYMAKANVLAQDDFPSLERVLWCGEVLPTPVLMHWMERLPHCRFTNLYGPTEATIASSYWTMPAPPVKETDPIPIGTPCAGEELLVLDESLRPIPTGEVGDLYIAGVGLSPGYWRDEGKTRAAFVPDPRAPDAGARIYRTGDLARLGEDGLFYFVGRADSQIKHRGYRVELGEVETALNAVAEVRECAVVGIQTERFEGTAICAAYAPAAGVAVETSALSESLRSVLPQYMVPSRWLELDGLPKNVNGKIDRSRLTELFAEAGS